MGVDIKMTRGKAIELAESNWWKGVPDVVVATFQLHTPLLCMNFGDFHSTLERVLGRGIQTIEFAFPQHLKDELRNLDK